jgi:hybrid polyketide synthase / nonribosomal peptide synthetase ACE1
MGVYKTIKQTLPPIAGVCNGAMVLQDGLLAKMPYETFSQVIRPKVEGTILLDELFSENNLDFFMVFSSLTCVTGNIGQSPYAASNCFMVAMAEGRRKRGLAGSVINLAGIFGIGYINRTDKKIHERLGNMGYGGISEWDFQQFFAEAADASRPDSGRHFEVSNGLKSFEPKDPAAPAWLPNSKFGRYVLKKGSQAAAKTDSKAFSLKTQLLEQTSEEGVYTVLLGMYLHSL